MNTPLVSISCITYNHEPYIRECLKGILMQQTDFSFEILIHDDASTDKTADIIREYEAKYPDIIKPIYQTENQWSKGIRGINIRFNFNRAQGKYIALCEGDDYWTDPYKLQKQVDILEANEDCSICFTDAKTYIQNEDKFIPNQQRNTLTKNKFDIYDLSKKHYIFTPTVLFLNKYQYFPKKLFNHVGGDTTLFLLLLEDGSKAIFLPEETTVYREHSGGVFSGRNSFPYEKRKELELGMVKMIQAWINHFQKDKILLKTFRNKKFSALNKLRIIALENNDDITAKKTAKRMIKMFPIVEASIKLRLSVTLTLLLPKTHGKYISNKTNVNA